ncbi:succinate-semialdehyde dehydrogenase [NADP(+)] [[Candida] railenensis]|uniref:Succinate-semialdehyde dehydrogenase n=1 Tax=[Candida] railenensis TaxID=45579 RepID=A0A9P0QKA9_9ASCO|nr:succinate-semialdehyde dehydrogenase [NADP(+)] [[Candida] railenensis]
MLRTITLKRSFVRSYSIEPSSKVISSLKNPDLFKTKGYVNGAWISGSSQFEVNNPALYNSEGGKIAEVDSFDVEHYETAVNAASDAFKSFKSTTGRYRSEILLNLYRLMLENKEDLAKLIVLENGKPYNDALGEVTYAASFFQWFSEEAPRVPSDIIQSSNQGNRILSIRQPIGVCGILTPWNFPAAMITRKLGAAVSVGCTTVIKPASETPLSALALAHLSELAGFPKGVVNVLPSHNSSIIGKFMCEHPKIKKISFTGSTNVGKILMTQSSSTLKKLSMELGGNAPFIVFDDADVDKAVDGAITSKFRSSGQTCVCANRIFVHESIYDEFQAKFVAKLASTVKIGYGLTEGITHGPVIHSKSMQKVRQHIEDATSKGAKILFGGSKLPDIGENFHELTVLGDVTTDMLISKEETFGPVAPLIKFSSDEEVLQMANDTDVGLAGYFYSSNVARIFRVAEELEVGMMGVNTGAISEAALPFGGVKESGFGREGSKYGVEDYTVIKGIVMNVQ